MEWQDEGVVLSVTRHGEADALLEVMTLDHGRARGFVKGGMGRRNKANLQAGNKLALNWRARLETNLGRFTVELVHSPLGMMMGDGSRLSALAAAVAVVAATMPEREVHKSVYEGLEAVVKLLEGEGGTPVMWAAALARLELGILTELGYGLDLTQCAATGSTSELVYVSPKSGRAVSAAAGAPYQDKLLPLPGFISGEKAEVVLADSVAAMKLTGFFLERNIWIVHGKGQPPARERLFASLIKAANGGK